MSQAKVTGVKNYMMLEASFIYIYMYVNAEEYIYIYKLYIILYINICILNTYLYMQRNIHV